MKVMSYAAKEVLAKILELDELDQLWILDKLLLSVPEDYQKEEVEK